MPVILRLAAILDESEDREPMAPQRALEGRCDRVQRRDPICCYPAAEQFLQVLHLRTAAVSTGFKKFVFRR